MKGFLVILLFLIIVKNYSFAQSADSLKKLLPQAKGEKRIDLLFELLSADPESSFSTNYAQEALQLSRQAEDAVRIAKALSYCGQSLFIRDHYEAALPYYQQSTAIARTLNAEKLLAWNFDVTGRIYSSLSAYDSALYYFIQSLERYEKLNEKSSIGDLLLQIGEVNLRIGDHDKALQYFRQAQQLALETGSKSALAVCFNNLGMFYSEQNDHSQALRYYRQSLELCRQENHLYGQATALNNIGYEYFELKDFDKALKYYELSLEIKQQLQHEPGIAASMANMGHVYLKKRDYPAALSLLQNSLQKATALGDKHLMLECREALKNTFLQTGQYTEAIREMEFYSALKDSLLSEEKARHMADIQTKYETQKKEQEIVLLRQQKDIKELQTYVIAAGALALMIVVGVAVWVHQVKIREALRRENLRKLAVSELKALRAKMNPHFIFNALNSIQRLVLQQDSHNAALYLQKFSRMVRLTLDYADQENIYLRQEIEYITLYLDLEQLRFEDKFITRIELDPSLDPENIKIPPLIIQPYLENAIKHGLLHKQSTGHLLVKMKAADGKLFCIVEDDGVGRERARELSQGQFHVSKGMKITAERLEIYNQAEQQVEIVDLYDQNKQAAGTRVELYLPCVEEWE